MLMSYYYTDRVNSSTVYWQPMGYHLRAIQTKGTYGRTSKIREELEELEESLEQDNRILALCELADLYGAIEGVAIALGSTMADVGKMAEATKRAFLDGSRKGKPVIEGHLEDDHSEYGLRSID